MKRGKSMNNGATITDLKPEFPLDANSLPTETVSTGKW